MPAYKIFCADSMAEGEKEKCRKNLDFTAFGASTATLIEEKRKKQQEMLETVRTQ